MLKKYGDAGASLCRLNTTGQINTGCHKLMPAKAAWIVSGDRRDKAD
jgi:hypothetical protein